MAHCIHFSLFQLKKSSDTKKLEKKKEAEKGKEKEKVAPAQETERNT